MIHQCVYLVISYTVLKKARRRQKKKPTPAMLMLIYTVVNSHIISYRFTSFHIIPSHHKQALPQQAKP